MKFTVVYHIIWVLTILSIVSCKTKSPVQEAPKQEKPGVEVYGAMLSGEMMVRLKISAGSAAQFLLFDLRGDSALQTEKISYKNDELCFAYREIQHCFTKHADFMTVKDTVNYSPLFDTLKLLPNELTFLPLEWRAFDSVDGKFDKLPTLIIDDEGSFFGYTGCNSMFGEYTSNNDSLRFDKIASTRRYCGETNPEQPFVSALRSCATFHYSDTSVKLYNEKDSLLLELMPYR